MVTNSGNSVRERVGEIVEKGMKEIGIGVSYELVEFGQARLTANRLLRLGGDDHRLHRRYGAPRRHQLLAQR